MSTTAATKSMEDIVALCKRRGFIFPASEIYGGINGFWDFGPWLSNGSAHQLRRDHLPAHGRRSFDDSLQLHSAMTFLLKRGRRQLDGRVRRGLAVKLGREAK